MVCVAIYLLNVWLKPFMCLYLRSIQYFTEPNKIIVSIKPFREEGGGVGKGRWSIADCSWVGGGEWFYLVYFWCSIEIPREIPPKRIRPAVPILDTRILNKQIYQILTHTYSRVQYNFNIHSKEISLCHKL